MIVAASTTALPMTRPHHDTLARLLQSLYACERGELPVAQLSAQWRSACAELPLPARYAEVLGRSLDRIEASALFSEESCSFSQKDLLNGLQAWAEKAALALNS